jgi:predicted TIM-barrel fold metal-dependent hydrolase
MKILDSHIHLFTHKVIGNVSRRTQMVQQLQLQTKGAERRTSPEALQKDLLTAGASGALLLPTASINAVQKTNRTCIETASRFSWLYTAGPLHPGYPHNETELAYLRANGVRVIKLCSFSQGFALDSSGTLKMFDTVQTVNEGSQTPFAVVLDTLQGADIHFGTLPEYNTTPKGLGKLAEEYPGINFIGAHMGGLNASFDEMRRYLTPRPNLFLDTSNEAHLLNPEDFLRLLETHGPRHILFGTDWPWFIQKNEVEHIDDLLNRAGFSENEKNDVFGVNASRLLGIDLT